MAKNAALWLGKAAIRQRARASKLALLTLEGTEPAHEFAAETLCARQRDKGWSRRWSASPVCTEDVSRGAEHDRDGEMVSCRCGNRRWRGAVSSRAL